MLNIKSPPPPPVSETIGCTETSYFISALRLIMSLHGDQHINWYEQYIPAHLPRGEKRILAFSFSSVCPHVCPSVRMNQHLSNWTDFYETWYWGIYVANVQILSKSVKCIGQLTRRSRYNLLLRATLNFRPSVRMTVRLPAFLSVCPHVCPSVGMNQHFSHWTDFHENWYWGIYVANVQIWSKSRKCIGQLTRRSRYNLLLRATLNYHRIAVFDCNGVRLLA